MKPSVSSALGRFGGGVSFCQYPIRPALQAAVSLVINRGPDAISAPAEATIGNYRGKFDKIVSYMQPEVPNGLNRGSHD